MSNIPDPNVVFPNEFKTSCFIKNVISAPNIIVGDYTYYDDPIDPTGFEKNNVLFNYPEFSSLRIKKQREVKNFCRHYPAGPRRIGLAQSSGKSTLPTKE